jgi:hypothetical protein
VKPFWRDIRGRVLANLEISGVFLEPDQARVIQTVLRRSAPPITPRETAIVTRFHMRVDEMGEP